MKATKKDYNRINEYFKETGWKLDLSEEVFKFDTIEETLNFLGEETNNKTYEEMEDTLDRYRNVWYDGEGDSVYYVIG